VPVDAGAADEVAAALELELDELPPQPASSSATNNAREVLTLIAGERYSLRVKLGADNFSHAMSESEAGAPQGLPMTTALELPGMRIKANLGVCYGLVVRSMGFVGGVSASFKALRRGEISQYTQLLEDSRRHAIDRMVDNARLLGAEAIIAVRFDSSEIGQQFTEIVAYGTAVTLAAGA
jgi:uncharacterized protein YbjQ (UPF0145 family)